MSDADLPPSADDDTPEAFDARRRRAMRRGVLTGVGIAGGLALLAGFGGATGQAGAAIFLLVSAVTCAGTATYGVLLAVRDDLKEQPVSRARIAWIIGLFFSAAALMAMTAGAGG